MEEGPDVVELPDSDEELARIQTADAFVAQQAYSAEIERVGFLQICLIRSSF